MRARAEEETYFEAGRIIMRRIGLCLAWSLGICLFMTGCWDRTELNELAITSATSFDWEDGEWVISYQVVNPSAISAAMAAMGGGAAKLPVVVYSTKGKTIREAIFKSTFESPRKLFFSHTRILVVSDAVARRGLTPVIDEYLRNPDVRETVSVLIAEGKARRILEQLMQIQIIPGNGIQSIIMRQAANLSLLPHIRIYDLAKSLANSAKSAVIPEILISGSPTITSEPDLNNTSPTSKLRLGRLAVLRHNKWIGWLTNHEALGVSYIRNQVQASVTSFACNASDRGKSSAFRLIRSTTRLTPLKEKDHYVMKIKVKGEGTLVETDCLLDLSKPEVIRQMEKQIEGEIKEAITASWMATKKLKTDVLGFADVIHRKYPKEWKELSKDWESTFVQMEIDPQVEMTIKRVGLSNRSFKMQTEQD
jgi:spore germination protein KC